MSHVFISYSTKNADYANQLADKLRDEGFDVWIDNAQLRSSDNWWESIVLALRDCAAFIVIMTPESRESKWVQREVTLADNWEKPTFPLLLDGENWEIFVLTQFLAVSDQLLPAQSFYDQLAEVVSPQQQRGDDVTKRPVTDVAIDTVLRAAIDSPPEPDESVVADNIQSGSGNIQQNIGQATGGTIIGTQINNPLSTAASEGKADKGGPSVQVIVAVIGLIGVILAALIGILPDLIDRLQPPTPDLTATHAITQTALAAIVPTETATNVPSPTKTPAPLSDTPTRIPTPEPDDNVPLAINPQTVQPGGEVVVTTEAGATCLFEPTVGSDFGFETSSGTILFVADDEPGVVVEVTCRIGERRSEIRTFTVAGSVEFSPTLAPPPGTATKIVQLDMTATEAMLQRTADTLATQNAHAFATSTAIAQAAAPTSDPDSLTLTIFRDEDSFTLLVPDSDEPVSLVGLEYRVTLSDGTEVSRRLDTDYAAFLGLPFNNITSLGAVCFRIVRSAGTRSVPGACQPPSALLLPHQIANADVFWRDRTSKIDRTVFVYQGDTLLGVCGSGDSCAVVLPLP